jgi:DNA-3-methyladenine glycosylase I
MTTQRNDERVRCPWPGTDPLYVRYHDEEWGVPVHDDRKLFEFLTLEGAQAGLSWITILRKRAAYARAFDDFDPERVASYDDTDVARLLSDTGIVRNAAKIRSAIGNARAFLRVREEFGSFAAYMWRFVDGDPIVNEWAAVSQIPASTPLSEAMSRDLRKRDFSFIGPTVCYSHMQAVGMVNDHIVSCFRFAELTRRPVVPSEISRIPESR